MGFLGGLIGAAVQGVGGGLRGQNEGDDELYKRRREEEADALRRFVAQRQMMTEEREARYTDAQIQHMGAEDTHLAAGDNEWHPRTMQEAIDFQLGANPQRTDRPAPNNIDPNGEEAYRRRMELERFKAGLPARVRAGTAGGQHADQIKDLNTTIDDTDRELGRDERAIPKAWGLFDQKQQAQMGDSTTYNAIRGQAIAKADSVRDRYDRFRGVRDSLVAVDHGINLGGPGKGEPQSVTPGTAVMHAAAHGAGGAIAPPPGARSGTPAAALAGAPAQPIAPDAQARVAELQAKYNAALAWRGPNGERKDPQALAQRYLEVIQQLTGQTR